MPTNALIKKGQQGLTKLNRRIDSFSVKYERSEALLTALVARTVLAGTLGVPKVRRAIKAQVKTMLQELDRQGVQDASQIVEQAYQLGIRLAAEEHTTTGRIDTEALKLLQENISGRLGDATTHVGRRVDDIFRKEGLRLAATSLSEQAAPDTNLQLQRRLVSQGITSFQDRRGRNWGLAQYARMAVTTVSAEATFLATQNTVIGKGLDVVDVNSVMNPCSRCKPYDGKTFSLTGRSNYPFLDTTFPIHPTCQHYVVVGRDAFDERRRAAA